MARADRSPDTVAAPRRHFTGFPILPGRSHQGGDRDTLKATQTMQLSMFGGVITRRRVWRHAETAPEQPLEGVPASVSRDRRENGKRPRLPAGPACFSISLR